MDILIFFYFYLINQGGIKSTDPNFEYYLPDNTKFTSPDEVEDWFILKTKQIENERIKILMNK